MSKLFFIIFIVLEVAQVVLTFTKAREKAVWLKTRAIVRLVETLALIGIVEIPSTHLKWRFTVCMIILFVRLLIAGIMWFAGRKKAVGTKSKAGAVVSCVLSVILIAVTLAPAFIFTNYNGLPTTGEFGVKSASAILVDESRTDTFENDGSYREVPIYFFYPDTESGSYPLVVFSHGAFGYYQSNFSTYEELASNGYVVAALDHPHHAFFTTDTQGKTVTVDQKFINDAMNINNEGITEEQIYETTQEWMKLRIDDENFVLDTIEEAKKSGTLGTAWHTEQADDVTFVLNMTDIEKIGLMGHSLGGATSTAVGRERDDIDAVIDLDGTMLSERKSLADGKYQYYEEPYPVPILDFTKQKDYNDREQYKIDNGYAYVNEDVIKNAKDGRTVIFSKVGHMDFTDLPLISPTLAAMLDNGKAEVDNAEFMTLVNSIVLNWFDYYLKGEGTLDIQANY